MASSSPKSTAMLRRVLLTVGLALHGFVWRWGVALPDDPPEGAIHEYFSAVDGSRQGYGLYVPRANPPSDSGYPLVMHAHGYGWSVSADFSPWQRRWADDHGWVLANVNGRGPNFYDGIGEDDVLRVLDNIRRLIAIDPTCVFMTGGSMGGTGAYRTGIRRPDVFSSVAPVDGWTDYRLYHKHWYERKDMPDTIEEFRRPLLEAVSTLYLAPTARWTDVQLYVDGEDNVVWPDNAFRMQAALTTEQDASPDAFRHDMIYRYDLGHGGGYDIRRIYEHFLVVAGLERPPAVSIQTTLLRYGKVHWASIDRFRVQGALGRLDVEAKETTAYVFTQNLDSFSLSLPDSPLARQEQVQVVSDGLPCYDGPPIELPLEAVRDEAGAVIAWQQVDTASQHLTKRRGLEGPIGEAFLAPFVVLWGTVGSPSAVRQGQIEAEDFAREWNDFNVHYDAVRARPEDELGADELKTHNLVIFGTLDTSSLLQQMDATHALPVRVFDDRVLVRDPTNGDRTYAGAKYGAYWVYPNPLTDFGTLVVGCKGRFATTAEGAVPRGLGYDLEKLQWAWGDYVVFDADIRELPYVENVNNKPPVLTYEAGYFVEAGFCDQDWRIDRAVELNRVRATRPERSRLIHVASVEPSVSEVAARPGIEVRVVDEKGEPVQQARVTLAWAEKRGCFSRPADAAGVAFFEQPQVPGANALVGEVVNVCATAATYSWPDDQARKAVVAPGGACGIDVAVLPAEAVTHEGGTVAFSVSVSNRGTEPLEVLLTPPTDPGIVLPTAHELSISAGATGEARFVWDAGELPPGRYAVPVAVQANARASGKISRPATVLIDVRADSRPDARIVRVWAPDRRLGEAFEVVAEIENLSEDREITVVANCVLMEARRYLPSQTVRLAPATRAAVRWLPTAGSRPLERGVHTASVSLAEVLGAVAQTGFVVK